MKIKGIKTKSDHYKFHLKNNLLLYLLLLIYISLTLGPISLHLCESVKHYSLEKTVFS